MGGDLHNLPKPRSLFSISLFGESVPRIGILGVKNCTALAMWYGDGVRNTKVETFELKDEWRNFFYFENIETIENNNRAGSNISKFCLPLRSLAIIVAFPANPSLRPRYYLINYMLAKCH